MKSQLIVINTLIVFFFCFLTLFSQPATEPRILGTKFYRASTAPTIDGTIGTDEIWMNIAPVYLTRSIVTENPTVTSCYYKAAWCDTAIFLLQYTDEDVFAPHWLPDPDGNFWEMDCFEWYIDVNDVLIDGNGPITPNNGHYQIAGPIAKEDQVGNLMEIYGSHLTTWYADTWDEAEAIFIRESYIRVGADGDIYTDDDDPWIPVNNSVIGFDAAWLDADVTAVATSDRQRQTWSNNGHDDYESWSTMDSCGVVTLSDSIINTDAPYLPKITDVEFLKTQNPPTIDGLIGADELWNNISPQYLTRNVKSENPTVDSCYFKAAWNDTAIFVLQYVDEDVFRPHWYSEPHGYFWLMDNFQWFLDLNDVLVDGLGPDDDSGHFEMIAPVQDPDQVGILTQCNLTSHSFWYADTWDSTEAVCIRESYIRVGEDGDFLVNGNPWTPSHNSVIGFDAEWIDVDTIPSPLDEDIRQRLEWSNTGHMEYESWDNMDASGMVILVDTSIHSYPPDMPRKVGTIFYWVNIPPTIDGTIETNEIWQRIPAIQMERSIVGEVPTVTAAYFKACWNDTALYVLQYVDDDVFAPHWISDPDGNHWQMDKFEWYLDLNKPLIDGEGPVGSNNGHYQFAPPIQTADEVGILTHFVNGDDHTMYADTWDSINAIFIRESYVRLGAGGTAFVNGNPWIPGNDSVIGFDAVWADVDVTTPIYDDVTRQRLVWSNTGGSTVYDCWHNMDSCGVVTLSHGISHINTSVIQNNMIVTPTCAKDFISVSDNVSEIYIYNSVGSQLGIYDTRIIHDIDISAFTPGVYFVTMSNKEMGWIKTEKIVVQP